MKTLAAYIGHKIWRDILTAHYPAREAVVDVIHDIEPEIGANLYISIYRNINDSIIINIGDEKYKG